MIGYADVIVDLQAGDTGKGKVAHHLAKNYDVVLRYNGGANAGHTVYHNGQKVVTHQVPIGILYGIPSIIGPGCVVNIQKLYEELDMLRSLGFTGKVYIDKRVHVTTNKHIEEDGTDTKIGTTRQGIGPTYRDKYARTGTRISELVKYNSTDLPYEIIDLYNFLHVNSTPLYNFLHVNSTPLRILCEGAQGFQIDIDWGDYPYVTSSHCTVGAACLNGIPPKKLRHIFGIMKAYETYSGFKTTFQDENDSILQKIQEIGGEFGATTGRKRKIRWLDLDGVIQATNINGVTDLIINKADVLAQVGVFKYVYKKTLFELDNLNDFQKDVNSIILNETDVEDITWSMTPNGI
jgi:adenylosuccinate synthase